MRAYEVVVGLEIHAQLLTGSKLFCTAPAAYGAEPNSNVGLVSLGLPGALPVLNARAVELALRAGLALDCTVHERSVFARKNYFYPDLPKGYQISQFDEPFATGGHLDVELDGVARRIGVTRIHMEEDAGKSLHGVGGDSIVDLNRAGVPLIEIVSEPDIRSSAEAAAYMRSLRDILLFIGVNDGNLEEGSLRCDANVSIRPVGESKLGTRVELKNINSFRFVQKAIDVEVARQTALLDAGGRVVQETRSFDPDAGTTATLRSKEDAHDYRYFPDPDIPPLVVERALIEAQRPWLERLPTRLRARWTEQLALPAHAAVTLTQHPAIADYFEATLARFSEAKRATLAPKAANWILTEVLRDARTHGLEASFPVSAAQVAELIELVEAGVISGKQAKQVHQQLVGTDKLPSALVEELGLRVVSDAGAIESAVRAVIADHQKQWGELRGGKKGLTGFFVGQVMKRTGGSAEPKLVSELLERLANES